MVPPLGEDRIDAYMRRHPVIAVLATILVFTSVFAALFVIFESERSEAWSAVFGLIMLAILGWQAFRAPDIDMMAKEVIAWAASVPLWPRRK